MNLRKLKSYSIGTMTNLFEALIEHLDPEPGRSGLAETPARAAKAWAFWTSGYDIDPKSLFKEFDDGAENYDQMIWVRNIPFYTHCEHHLAPFFGTATVAYIPDGKIVGISKINRVVSECLARRLQVQERFTRQIADIMQECLTPKGVGVLVRGRHLCVESRGVGQQGTETVTSALRGAMLNEPQTRSEFMLLAK